MAAWLMRGAVPAGRSPAAATRPRRVPDGGKTLPADGPGAGRLFGASASIALVAVAGSGTAETFGVGSRAEWRPQPGRDHARAKQPGLWQHPRQHGAQQAFGQRPRIVPFDPGARAWSTRCM
jgi:hypothetical protein